MASKKSCKCRGKGWDVNPLTRQKESCPVCNPSKATTKLKPSETVPAQKKTEVEKDTAKKEEKDGVSGK